MEGRRFSLKEKTWRRFGKAAAGFWPAWIVAAAGCVAGGGGQDPGKVETLKALHALGSNPWEDPDRVVATVNGRSITQGEFYRRFLKQFGLRRFLEGLLAEEIVSQEALKRNIVVTPEEVDRHVTEALKEEERQAGGREAFEKQLNEFNLTLDDVRKERSRDAEARLLVSKLVKSLRAVNDEVLREYYKGTYANTRYATRHIAYSFRPQPGHTEADLPRLKMEAHNRAARAADRARKGADFAAMARAESEDTYTASRGGDLGAIPNDPRVPEYMRVVFNLAAGEVSDPVENPQGGYHVFQVTAILPGESFVDCKEKMQSEILEGEPAEDEIRAVLQKLRSQAEVALYPGTEDVKKAETP